MSTALVKKQTDEALAMMSERDIDVFGRISAGWDADTDFDALPTRLVDVTEADVQSAELFTGETVAETLGRISSGWDADTDFDALPTRLVDVTEADVQSAELFTGDEEFESPVETFPVFKQALRHFQATAAKPRAVRIDTVETYDGFVGDKAAGEIARQLNDLRAVVENHISDGHGPVSKRVRNEVLGAVQTIKDLSTAKTATEATDKFKPVPISVPDFAEGKVKCWEDDCGAVILSLHFAMPDGAHRVATSGAKPHLDEDELMGWAERAGYDPVTILGAAPAIAAVVTGKRLLKDTAAAALEARERADVACAEDEPVVMIGLGESTAPLAAMMYLQQKAEHGDVQAQRELAIMHVAAQTPSGQQIAAPLLAEADRRLNEGRTKLLGA